VRSARSGPWILAVWPLESDTVDAPARIRASDADRDRVLDVLGAAAGDGRLTLLELDERTGAALSARTLSELAALTADW